MKLGHASLCGFALAGAPQDPEPPRQDAEDPRPSAPDPHLRTRAGATSSPSGAATILVADALSVELGSHACLEAGRLAEQIATWTGSPRIDARLRIRVLEDQEERERVRFILTQDEELLVDRPFEPVPNDCVATHAALGLAIAFTLDATVLAGLGVEAPRAEAPTEVPPEAEGDHTQETRTRGRAALRISSLWAAGINSKLSLGAAISTSIPFSARWDLRIGALFVQGRAQRLGEGLVRTQSFALRADLCGGGRLRPALDLRGCGGIAAGPALSRGSGFARDSSVVSRYVAAVLGTQLAVPAHQRAAFLVHLDLVLPLTRPRPEVLDEDSGEVLAGLHTPPVGAILGLGLALYWP